MDWKEFWKQVFTMLATIAFTAITGEYTDFPLDQKTWVNFILWIVGLFGIFQGLRFSWFSLRYKIHLERKK